MREPCCGILPALHRNTIDNVTATVRVPFVEIYKLLSLFRAKKILKKKSTSHFMSDNVTTILFKYSRLSGEASLGGAAMSKYLSLFVWRQKKMNSDMRRVI